MSKILPPPLYETVIDETGVATIPWTLFFNRLFTGDTGTDWTPSLVNLGSTGTPSFSGRYYKVSRALVYFRAVITPDTDTTSTSASTYIENFPLSIAGDGAVIAVAPASNVGVGLGVISEDSGRIYLPAWTSATVPIIILGMVEAQ